MMHVPWVKVFVVILIFVSLAACGDGSSVSKRDDYSNATLSGTWIISEKSKRFYMSTNENGRFAGYGDVTEISLLDPLAIQGIYSVSSDGSFGLYMIDPLTGESIDGSGKLLSATSATITLDSKSGTMTKVTDFTACRGHYYGTISTRGITNNISFDVDSSGAISNFSSDMQDAASATGNAFATGSNAVITIRISGYREISAWGTLANGRFTGSFNYQSYSEETGTIALVKS